MNDQNYSNDNQNQPRQKQKSTFKMCCIGCVVILIILAGLAGVGYYFFKDYWKATLLLGSVVIVENDFKAKVFESDDGKVSITNVLPDKFGENASVSMKFSGEGKFIHPEWGEIEFTFDFGTTLEGEVEGQLFSPQSVTVKFDLKADNVNVKLTGENAGLPEDYDEDALKKQLAEFVADGPFGDQMRAGMKLDYTSGNPTAEWIGAEQTPDNASEESSGSE
ncbi:MAG: hypothetical protein NUW37_06125 [Planctomycetes bacterium]|nr:hypothetical protein [Planctomycetota bacterium]